MANPLRIQFQLSFYVVLSCALAVGMAAQDASPTSKKPDDLSSSEQHVVQFSEQPALSEIPKNIVLDQKLILTSPLRLKARDLTWAVPFGFATAFTFGVDHAIERELPTSTSTIQRASSFSNYAAAGFAAGVAGGYLLGVARHDDHMRTTAILAGEAAVDSTLLTGVLKSMTWRERPTDRSGQGEFYQSSTAFGSSFPSLHSAAAWSIATVVANEYPGPLTKLFAYGGASAISVSRIVGRKHFASDVMIGSALGWYVGRQVYKARSPRAQDAEIGTFVQEPGERNLKMMASPYVDLDSWVYPAFDRLDALGLVPTAIMGLRPWTRMECARLLSELRDDRKLMEQTEGETSRLVTALDQEFSRETAIRNGGANLDVRVESFYSRSTFISGTPLTDSLHFGQTLTNGYGRPYSEGLNQAMGASAAAEAGPIGVYVRGEYQHAPSADALPLGARTLIADRSQLPIMPGSPIAEVNRFRLLDSYIALNLNDWQLSFGRQSLWWGPGESGDLMMSNNAEPLWMLRASRISPFKMPGLLKFMGPVRSDTFVGQIRGYHFLRTGPTFIPVGSWDTYVDPQPFIWGEKFNFKPTQNLEFGFSITTVFAGQGRPMTLDTFAHTFSSRGNAQDVEPGDRRTGFDFAYRLPGLRRWVKLYNGSLAEDEPNPIAYPRRSAMNPGIYIVRIPRVPKLDFRAEGVYTDLPNLVPSGVFYTNAHYAGGYTNYGGVMGNWVGPQGHGVQLWSTYWFSSKRKLQLGWRQQVVDRSYLQGGNLHDYSASYNFDFAHGVEAKTWFQMERTNYPALDSRPRNNAALSITLTYRPDLRRGPKQ
jgi:membrane-associated phospholipid phosphatase